MTKVVVSADPFHVTVVEDRKPLPLIVTGRSGEPAVAFAGLRLVMAGTGLFTVKLTAAEVPPPGDGFATVSFATPPFAKSDAGIVACRLVDEAKVVVSAVPFH